ncbi:histidinol-phosphate aminotransferase [Actinomycetospora cinnamomea]|uniref:Aromatic amino acid aminotransferase n=1 Tax=Actinomycetospora cinnamomea TaxID=663609 RepID=A0A2U1FBE9_9PSEU|nr:histidinol-phosphate aminotransferase [Actinomycetospora cinnamomea]
MVGVPVRLRDDLAALPTYVAGRTVPGAVKLASNEMPLPPLPAVLDAVDRAAQAGNRYPDIAVTTLTARLAEHHGVDPARIAVGCGSVALCGQLVQALCAPGDEVVFAWRSFEAYPIVALAGHARAVRVPLTPGHVHDLDAMADAVTERTRLVFVCNPNNPTGTAVDEDALRTFLARIPDDVLVVLDEAYREFVSDPAVPDGLALAAELDNVCVLRTFSKAHRLAGLRVGYAVAPPELAAALRGVAVPFAVSAVAQAAALAALDHLDELHADCAGAVTEVARMTSELRSLGYEVPPSQSNFVWLPLGERAAEFAEHALENKVVVRAFAGDGVRVSAGTAEEVDLFLAAAGSFPR